MGEIPTKGLFLSLMRIEYVVVKTDLAGEVGLVESIILGHFHYWLNINSSDPSMFKDGRVWLFASRRAIQDALPFLSDKVIRGGIERLIEKGWVLKGEYSLSMTSKATWYSLSDMALSWFNGSQSPLALSANASAHKANDIKDNNKKEYTIEEKKRIFREKCEPYVETYGRKMIDDFLNYWCAENDTHTLLACEIAKRKSGTFDIASRLRTWAGKEYNKPSVQKPVSQPKPQTPKRTPWEQMGLTEEQYRTIYK